MTNKRKGLVTLMAAVLLVAMSVMGTMAYLTSQAAVTNTFTVGNITITLDETDVDNSTDDADRDQANAYKLLPGHTYVKDPIVHVAAGSEDSFLFVKVANNIVDIEDADATVAAQMAANGWLHFTDVTEGEGDAQVTVPVYVFVGAPAAEDKAPVVVPGGSDVPVFETFKVDGAVENERLAAYANKTIVVTAYAVQKDGFDTAADAWNATFGK